MFRQKTNIKNKIGKSTTSHHIDVTLLAIAEKVTELPFGQFPVIRGEPKQIIANPQVSASLIS